MVAVQDLLWTGTPQTLLVGSLGEGLYLTHNNGTPTCTVTLWEAGDPPTALDTATFGTVVSHNEYPVANDSGLIGIAYRAASNVRHLVIPTQSGGALTLTDHTLSSTTGDLYAACHDGSGFLYKGGGTVISITTAGGTAWTAATSDTLIAYPSVNRFISQGSVYSLRTNTGSVLDTEPYSSVPDFVEWLDTGTDLTTWILYDISGQLMRYRTVDTSADTLVWTSGTATFDPGWGTTQDGFTVDPGEFSCWNGQIACLWGLYAP
jgi:hypothetical protein